MTCVLVTGATGFLGEHLCRVLAEQGHTVRGLARSRSNVLADAGVEMIRGDVLSGPELDRALEGVDAVCHLAGAVSRDPDDAQRMMRLHVDGTRRVLERMAAAGLTRMVLASTSGTIGVSKDEAILDENAPYAEEIVAGWPYYASKIYQERLAFEHGPRLGIEVVAVNPSLLLGPGDRRLSSTGDVRKFLKRQIPTVPAGGMNFVDARDAAVATANALRPGAGGRALPARRAELDDEGVLRAPRPRRQRRASAAQAAGRNGASGAPRSSRRSTGIAARSHRSIGSPSRWPSTSGGSIRGRRSPSSGSPRAIRSSRWSIPSRTCARASTPTDACAAWADEADYASRRANPRRGADA